MDIRLNTIAAALALALLTSASSIAGEILDGQTVATRFELFFPHSIPPQIGGNVYSVVGPGTELMDFGGVDVDFSDTKILITSLTGDFPGGYVTDLVFQDTFRTIPRFIDVTLNPASTWAGHGIHFDANQIRVNLADAFHTDRFEAGQYISLDLTGMIPEPATLGIALVGCLVLPALRRFRN
jgi:hypothetical protein